jgi:hypothetical protein
MWKERGEKIFMIARVVVVVSKNANQAKPFELKRYSKKRRRIESKRRARNGAFSIYKSLKAFLFFLTPFSYICAGFCYLAPSIPPIRTSTDL